MSSGFIASFLVTGSSSSYLWSIWLKFGLLGLYGVISLIFGVSCFCVLLNGFNLFILLTLLYAFLSRSVKNLLAANFFRIFYASSSKYLSSLHILLHLISYPYRTLYPGLKGESSSNVEITTMVH